MPVSLPLASQVKLSLANELLVCVTLVSWLLFGVAVGQRVVGGIRVPGPRLLGDTAGGIVSVGVGHERRAAGVLVDDPCHLVGGVVPGMFWEFARDPPSAIRETMVLKGLFTSPGFVTLPRLSWGRDQRPQVPPPDPRPLPSSLCSTSSITTFRTRLTSPTTGTCRPTSASRPLLPACTSLCPRASLVYRISGGRSLFVVSCFPQCFPQYMACSRGRSSKGRSFILMGFEPAVVSERPYDQSG